MAGQTRYRWCAALAVASLTLASCADGSTPEPASMSVEEGLSAASPTAADTAADTAAVTTTSAPTDGLAIAWQTEGCADSILATELIIVANCDGSVAAHDRADGTLRWGQFTNDDGSNTPGTTVDGTVVYTPLDSPEHAVAFDGSTGREVEVPDRGVRTIDSVFVMADGVVPSGYAYGPDGLRRGDALIWPGGDPDVIGPFVHRQEGVTVINDLDEGLLVVADDGTVLLAPELGQQWGPGSPIYDVGHGQAAVATSDGVLYLLDLRPRPAPGTSESGERPQ